MDTVVVTGGAGYIGSHIIKLLCEKGYCVVSIDKKETGHIIDPLVKIEVLDLRDFNALKKALQKFSSIKCIIHCAGELGIARSFSEKELFYEQNVLVTDHVLAAMILFDIKNIIYASSAALYTNNDQAVNEEFIINPFSSPYAMSKYLSEEKIKMMAQSFDINYSIFRYFNVVGCFLNGEHLEEYLLKPNIFPQLINAFYKSQILKIYGNDYLTKDGTCVRDYVSVRDLAQAHVVAFEKMKSEKVCDTFNIGSGTSRTVIDVIQEFERYVKARIVVQVVCNRKGDASYLCSDNEKIQRVFAWKPEDDIDTIFNALLCQK